MKKHKIIVSLLTVPLALFAQSNPSGASTSSNVKAGALSGDEDVVLNLPGQDVGAEASTGEEETISVDFPDEDVRTILRSVADLYDLNLVIPDGLQGRTSVKLRNITWDQVFEVVLDPLGYTFIEDRNIIRIKSIEELTAEPVDTRIFIVSYARADEMKDSIEPLIDSAAGGSIQVDVRSNALIVKERPSRMGKIQSIIESLDQPTEQVMIESKFIEVTDTDVKNIGINWSSLSDLSVAAGSSFTGVDGSIGGVTTAVRRLSDNDTETVGEAVLSAEQFDAVISALESKNDVELVSNPTVVALNNTTANITIGDRFPFPNYAFNAQTGERQIIGFEFIDVGIKLDVTPSVNDAGFINLDITPEVATSSETITIEDVEIPLIETRRTQSSITIKDGYTLALGGLVENEVRANVSKVPLLGDIPGIGRFFRSNTDTTESTNLIIFITAKILDPDGNDYRDVIDPRILNEMQIVPSDLPGYDFSNEELRILKEKEDLLSETKFEETFDPIQEEVDAMKAAKEKERLKKEKKDKKKKPSKELNVTDAPEEVEVTEAPDVLEMPSETIEFEVTESADEE